jgi:hypothetical protein
VRISSDGFKHLAKLHLTHLNLSASYITDAGLVHLPRSLIELDIGHCHSITDAGLKHLAKLPLKQLDCRGCRNITVGRAWRIWNSSPFNLS